MGVSTVNGISGASSNGISFSGGVIGVSGETAQPILLIVNGESNSGGLGENSSATAGELAARSSVQILDVTQDPMVFVNLDVGTNNLRDHAELSSYYATAHGIELGVANCVEAGRFNVGQIYMVKTGQGGSRIAQWAEGNGSGYWTKFAARIARAKVLLGASYSTYRKVVYFSLGINDIIATTNEATWKAAVKAHLQNIRDELEDQSALILITDFIVPPLTAGNDVYNDSIAAIASEMTNVIVLSTANAIVTGNAASDTNHWNYQDNLLFAERAVDEIVGVSGTLSTPSLSPAGGTYEGDTSVTISQSQGANIRYTTDGTRPSSHSSLYTGPIEVSADTTIKAIAQKKNYKNSAVASEDYDIDTPSAFVQWTDFINTVADGDSIDCTDNSGAGPIGAGARADITIDATQPFRVEWELETSAKHLALVVYLDDEITDTFVWAGGKVFLTGAYWYDGSIYHANGGYNATSPDTQALPVRMKMEKSGNNIVVSKSTNGGVNWTVTYTDTGRLSGKSTIYLKALFAVKSTLNTTAVELFT